MITLRVLRLIALLVLVSRLERADGATLQTLHNFGRSTDGAQPEGGLVPGADGNFYGTTVAGGASGVGTVFKISPTGLTTTLHSFKSLMDGRTPVAGLVLGTDGNFYGTTLGGGTGATGTVFQISATGTLTILHSFRGSADGAQPYGNLVEGSAGQFYGTTYGGGPNGSGTVFRITSTGSLTTLYSFSGGLDGGGPTAGLVQGTDGNFYGTTYGGGFANAGSIFTIGTDAKLTTLYRFSGGVDGGGPLAGLVQGTDGDFYGTTSVGGLSNSGTVFRVSATGVLTTLYTFSGGVDGAFPQAPLVEGSDGNFYGTTVGGGPAGAGTIFQISPAGALTTLYAFTGGADGAAPLGGLIESGGTNFFGVTAGGGSRNAGTVFRLSQPCTYSLVPGHATASALDSSGTFRVTVGGTFGGSAGSTNCPWSATSNVSWITITSGRTGVGDGMVAYSVAANASTSARTGTITIADKAFTVTQPGQVFGRFLQGTYNGLALQTNAPASSGFISLVLGKTGSFTASLTMGGARAGFKGQFDAAGNATNTVARRTASPLQVILHLLDVTNGTDAIVGTVGDGGFTADLLADLAVFTTANPCPWAGRYTLLLEPADRSDPSVPQGFGYGALTVTTTGSGRLQGVLGDGSKFNATVPVSGSGTAPLYSPLYKAQGACVGWITFATNQTLTATVAWFKPPVPTDHFYPTGFTTRLSLAGALYLPPTAGGPALAGHGQLTIGGGNLPTNLVKNVTIDARGTVVVSPAGSDHLVLKIQPTTGQCSGSFLDPTRNKTVKLSGLIVQPDNAGAGFFLGTNQTGFVTLEPAP